ncbi:hypothetical protein ACOMHN_008318 [Nucella lapillus]
MADPHRQAKVTGKRRVLTLSERLRIIKAVEDSPHKSRTQMAIDLGVPLPTLSNIRKVKNKYFAQARSSDIVTTSKRHGALSWRLWTKRCWTGLRHAGGLFLFFSL